MPNSQTCFDHKRATRLLAYLTDDAAHIEMLKDPASVLLSFTGKRKLKCEMAIVRHWLASGVVKLIQTRLSITSEGLAHLERAKMGTEDFLIQHAVGPKQIVDESGTAQTIRFNHAESPLGKLSMLRTREGQAWLTIAEIDAAERLRKDFENAQMRQRVTMSYDPTAVAKGRNSARNASEDLSVSALSARERVSRALDKLGPELSGIALDICCFLKNLETVELERQWPRRSAKLMLKTALSVLARHYHPVAKGRAQSAGIVSWAMADNRPSLR